METTTAQEAPPEGKNVGLAGGDLYWRVMGLGCTTPTSWSEEQFAYYLNGFLDARTAAAEEVARSVVPGWIDKPAGPGFYWVRNWISAVPYMHYRIVEIFEVLPSGMGESGDSSESGLWVRAHGCECPEPLEFAFKDNGMPWEQLAFMAIPIPNLPEPANTKLSGD